MTASIYGEIQRFDPEAVVVLYEVHNKDSSEILRFHAGVNEFFGNIIWQGNTYTAIPIKAEGFDFTSDTLPRPKLSVANYAGAMSDLVQSFDDLIGYKVVRKVTLSRYLDAVNFPAGNPTANPSQHFEDQEYTIFQKTQENNVFIEFELASALELTGCKIPRRQCLATVCTWIYKGEGCGYTGEPVATEFDVLTDVAAMDKCSHKVSGCKLRFGDSSELPFGGFVGMRLAQM